MTWLHRGTTFVSGLPVWKSSVTRDTMIIRHRDEDLARIFIGIGLIFSFFLPIGVYQVERSSYMLFGFLVPINYVGVIIGVIMIFYYKLSFFHQFPLSKFLSRASIIILVSIFLNPYWIMLVYWHRLIGVSSDIDFMYYFGSAFYIVISITLFALGKFHMKRNIATYSFLLLCVIILFWFLVLRFVILILHLR